jgi:hypothetical protein
MIRDFMRLVTKQINRIGLVGYREAANATHTPGVTAQFPKTRELPYSLPLIGRGRPPAARENVET